MANRLVYCTEGAIRVHIGALRLPSTVNLDTAAEAASNEVDGLLGQIYRVPLTFDVNIADEKASAYWLQSVTALIGAARILLSTASAGSQDSENKYGNYLLRNALAQIQLVLDGKRTLPGAEETTEDNATNVGPVIINGDAYSQVDNFYDNFEADGFIPGFVPRSKGTSWPR